ncbi:CoA-binding protein [Phaeodactylibacter xiamenensis]|uniref:CoA-binding protein n=1 Tax=Phaeodactylibacter xiamenensis TaxID=1524460 RepID=A0A098S5H2_9BACT|nr:CoA-binding protein [Phaeodactylibacter xiamenensis]KGE87325.1 CoA-binding protein [Phaeodactylibacter xiamenensis]MCR9055034.1 CoA-binding protein [bacterium]
MKKTVVLGASPKPIRYSYAAVQQLTSKGHEAVPIGVKDGEIDGIEIIKGTPDVEDVHTITLYLSPPRQAQYYDYIFSLNPKRLIFNPGTENLDLIQLAKDKGVDVEVGCTLVMLSVGNY